MTSGSPPLLYKFGSISVSEAALPRLLPLTPLELANAHLSNLKAALKLWTRGSMQSLAEAHFDTTSLDSRKSQRSTRRERSDASCRTEVAL